jgi:hypothetical protein
MVKESTITKPLKKEFKKSSIKKEKEILFNGNNDFNEIWNNVEEEHIIAFKKRMEKNWEVNIEPSYKNAK